MAKPCYFCATQRRSVLQPIVDADPTLDLIFVEGTKKYVLPEDQKEPPFKHDVILEHAISSFRNRYESRPDPDLFLKNEFTLLQLREVSGAVRGHRLDKDLFRRKMQPHLLATRELSTGTVGKPAELFRGEMRGARAYA